MLAYYVEIKAVHVAAVFLSGTLFFVRGVLVQLGRPRVAMLGSVRYASYAIDTVLLSAALMLVALLPGAVFANHWLTAKLALLVAYVTLGTLALRRGATGEVRRASFIAAIATFVIMIGIARAHHPLGWLHRVS